MKRLALTTVVALLAVALSVNAFAKAKPKITKAKAQAIALQRAAGRVEASELEKEHGKWVYSFDIRNSKGTITEVQVEAYTGKIVSVKEEDAAAEAKEKAGEAKEKRKGKGKH